MTVERSTSTGSLFRIPGYPAWFGADTFLLAGSAVHWIVVSVMAFELSGSVTTAGWFATLRGVMSAVTQVTGGTFIDRHDHRRLILAQSGSCAVLWLAMGLFFVFGRLSFPLFAALCLTSSAIFGFLGGTTNAALIRVVGSARYAEAESVNQGRDAAVNTAGSPLGATLFGISHAFPFFASAVCDAVAFACGLALKLPAIVPEDQAALGSDGALGREAPSFLRDTLDGWRWVLASRTIVSGVAVIGVVQFSLFAVHQAVNLNLVARGIDPLLISVANVGTAVGTMTGSVVSTRVCRWVPVGRGVTCILVGVALAYLPMTISEAYGWIVLSTCLASLPMPLFNALLSGFVFSKTPVEKQGRTRAVIMCATMLFGSLAGAVAGELLPRIGFSAFVATCAALSLVAALLAALNPRIREIPVADAWDAVAL